MAKRKPTPMNNLHRVVQVPPHTRNGRQVKGHTRRVPMSPVDVGGGFSSPAARAAIRKEDAHLPRITPPTGGMAPGYPLGGPYTGTPW